MIKEIKISVSCTGLCFHCNSEPIIVEEVPDDWDEMSADEQDAYVKEVFFGNFEWSYAVFQNGKELP